MRVDPKRSSGSRWETISVAYPAEEQSHDGFPYGLALLKVIPIQVQMLKAGTGKQAGSKIFAKNDPTYLSSTI